MLESNAPCTHHFKDLLEDWGFLTDDFTWSSAIKSSSLDPDPMIDEYSEDPAGMDEDDWGSSALSRSSSISSLSTPSLISSASGFSWADDVEAEWPLRSISGSEPLPSPPPVLFAPSPTYATSGFSRADDVEEEWSLRSHSTSSPSEFDFAAKGLPSDAASQLLFTAHLADVMEVNVEEHMETVEKEGAGAGTEFAIYDFSEAEYLSVEDPKLDDSHFVHLQYRPSAARGFHKTALLNSNGDGLCLVWHHYVPQSGRAFRCAPELSRLRESFVPSAPNELKKSPQI